MKLIYISHSRFPSEKSLAHFTMKTCEGFSREGLEVELWIPRRFNPDFRRVDPFPYYQIEKNFVIRKLPVIDLTHILPGGLGFYLLLLTFNISQGIYILLRGLRAKAIFYFQDVRDAVVPAIFGRNIFLEIHDFYKSRIEWVNRLCFRKAQGYIITNHIKMKMLREEFGIRETAMLHEPCGVDIKKFGLSTSKEEARRVLGLPSEKKIILYTGHLYGWKGARTLFDAHYCLGEGEVIYFNGGTDEDIEYFRLLAREQGVKNVVIFGRGLHAEVPLWLRAADVLVVPNTAQDPISKFYTSPLKLFEYMASGRPTVASDLPSIRNIVDETMVWFFEPDNPQHLCDVIRTALSNIHESAQKAERAREEIEKYSARRRSQRIVQFLKQKALLPENL